MTKVLIVSKDKTTKTAIEKTLIFNGFKVQKADSCKRALKQMLNTRFDFIMIDLQLKRESGLALYKSLRNLGNHIPVLMIGEGELDKFILEDLAVENYDFIMKPVMFNELKEKVNSFLEKNFVQERILSFGDLEIDCRQQLVIFRDKLMQVSRMEIDILIMMAQKGGEAIHPNNIAKVLQHESKFYTMSTFYFISRLREKIRQCGDHALDICFVKDQGYKLAYV